MRFRELKRMSEAPVRGWLLAYTRRKVIFRSYGSLKEAEGLTGDQELLELHLFDKEKEYRCIETRSPRYEGGIIEAVIDFPENDELEVYAETVMLEKEAGGGSITILNHLKYFEENGMVTVDDYRLRMGEERHG